MKPGESKADQQTIRDSKTAGQREVRAHAKEDAVREAERQFDGELGKVLDRQEAALVKPKLPLWQRFLAWLDRVA